MHLSFLYFALFVFISCNIYLFIRGWQALPGNSILHALYTGIFLFVIVSFFFGVFLRGSIQGKPGIVFHRIGGYWLIFFTFFLLAALFADFLRVLNYFFGVLPAWVSAHYAKVKLIYFASILLFPLIVSLYGFNRFSNPQTVELNISIDKNTGHFENLTIVAASDIHLGKIVRQQRLADWVEKINNQDPDIILLVGDIFDRSYDFAESQSFEEELMKLKSRYGVYAVLGNHEYYADVNKSINSLERSGIKLLRDQSVIVDNRFVIIGRDDATNTKRKPVDSLVSGIDPNLPVILMDHQPILSESIKNKIDLQISGHLHNGQIYPYSLILSRLWELSYGYRKIGDTHFYVSSGLGLVIAPIRFGTQSEIVHILLKTKSDTLTMAKNLKQIP